jgi:hypothetical protein
VARYRAAFAGEAFDLVVIDDARSLAEGYNRGIARASGANIVFSHDDAFPISSAFADRLAAYLEQVDIVGIAGATATLSGFWGYAGQPHTHGHVIASAPKGSHVDLLVWGAAGRRVDDIRLLDGCIVAARRDVAVAIGLRRAAFRRLSLVRRRFFVPRQRRRTCGGGGLGHYRLSSLYGIVRRRMAPL